MLQKQVNPNLWKIFISTVLLKAYDILRNETKQTFKGLFIDIFFSFCSLNLS